MNSTERKELIVAFANLLSLRRDVQYYFETNNEEQQEAAMMDADTHYAKTLEAVTKIVKGNYGKFKKEFKLR